MAKIYTYPYAQPYKRWDFTNRRDFFVPFIEADMFYIPYEVNSFETQLEKYFWTVLFNNIPFFNAFMVLTVYIIWFMDFFTNV